MGMKVHLKFRPTNMDSFVKNELELYNWKMKIFIIQIQHAIAQIIFFAFRKNLYTTFPWV